MGRKSLDDVKIASPCSASWEEMDGTERVRYCEDCELHVYNLSAMSREEAEILINQNEGRICKRLYRRKDGTILTQDCPVGLRAVRRRIGIVVGLTAATMLYILSSTFLPLLGITGGSKEQRQQQKNRTLVSILDLFDPVEKWEPVDLGPQQPMSFGW